MVPGALQHRRNDALRHCFKVGDRKLEFVRHAVTVNTDDRRGGRHATAGAIAGPLVELDVRTLYLKDPTLFGCTFQEDEVFANLVSCIERGEIRPLVAKTFPLSEIRQAQTEFLAKAFAGKLVLAPPD